MLNVLIAIVSDSYDTAMATASEKFHNNLYTQVRAADFHVRKGPTSCRDAQTKLLIPSQPPQVMTGARAYPPLGLKLKRLTLALTLGGWGVVNKAVEKAVDAAFKENAQVGRILDITERVNDQLQQEMNRMQNQLNKIDKMEEKLDKVLGAIQRLGGTIESDDESDDESDYEYDDESDDDKKNDREPEGWPQPCTPCGPLQEGMKVEVRYQGKRRYYPGRIKRVNFFDGTYDIKYDDGEEEFKVKEELIRSFETIWGSGGGGWWLL